MKLNKYWFKPKRYGYGAYPSTWEGWLTIIIIMILFTYDIIEYTKIKSNLSLISAISLMVILVIISYIKTEGDWSWHWGK